MNRRGLTQLLLLTAAVATIAVFAFPGGMRGSYALGRGIGGRQSETMFFGVPHVWLEVGREWDVAADGTRGPVRRTRVIRGRALATCAGTALAIWAASIAGLVVMRRVVIDGRGFAVSAQPTTSRTAMPVEPIDDEAAASPAGPRPRPPG